MYPKINIYLNGEYVCSTNSFPTCKAAIKEIRTDHFLNVATLPECKYITVYDYDKLHVRKAGVSK